MFTIHRAHQRGHTNIGWLNSWHSFSFGDYYDPNNMGFRSLRVINDDIIKESMGFGTHGHRDMEIVTYMLQGQLQHRDSLGNGDVLRPGDVQRMSAGSGIRHSEFNPSAQSVAHLLQIWLEPRQPGGAASYEQKHFTTEQRTNAWCPIVSGNAIAGTLPIQTDVNISASLLAAGKSLEYPMQAQRHGYLHVATGAIQFGSDTVNTGDAIRFSNVERIVITANVASELLFFDLA